MAHHPSVIICDNDNLRVDIEAIHQIFNQFEQEVIRNEGETTINLPLIRETTSLVSCYRPWPWAIESNKLRSKRNIFVDLSSHRLSIHAEMKRLRREEEIVIGLERKAKTLKTICKWKNAVSQGIVRRRYERICRLTKPHNEKTDIDAEIQLFLGSMVGEKCWKRYLEQMKKSIHDPNSQEKIKPWRRFMNGIHRLKYNLLMKVTRFWYALHKYNEEENDNPMIAETFDLVEMDRMFDLSTFESLCLFGEDGYSQIICSAMKRESEAFIQASSVPAVVKPVEVEEDSNVHTIRKELLIATNKLEKVIHFADGVRDECKQNSKSDRNGNVILSTKLQTALDDAETSEKLARDALEEVTTKMANALKPLSKPIGDINHSEFGEESEMLSASTASLPIYEIDTASILEGKRKCQEFMILWGWSQFRKHPLFRLTLRALESRHEKELEGVGDSLGGTASILSSLRSDSEIREEDRSEQMARKVLVSRELVGSSRKIDYEEPNVVSMHVVEAFRVLQRLEAKHKSNKRKLVIRGRLLYYALAITAVGHIQRVVRSFLARRRIVKHKWRHLIGWHSVFAARIQLQAVARGFLVRLKFGIALSELPQLVKPNSLDKLRQLCTESSNKVYHAMIQRQIKESIGDLHIESTTSNEDTRVNVIVNRCNAHNIRKLVKTYELNCDCISNDEDDIYGCLAMSLSRRHELSGHRQRIASLGFVASSITIQAFMRCCLAQFYVSKLRYDRYKESTHRIQQIFRMFLARRRLRELSNERNKTILNIQECASDLMSPVQSSPSETRTFSSIIAVKPSPSSGKKHSKVKSSRLNSNSILNSLDEGSDEVSFPWRSKFNRVSLRSRGPESRLKMIEAFTRMTVRVLARDGAAIPIQCLVRGHLARIRILSLRVAREEARGMADRARLRRERAHATKLNRARGEKIRAKRAEELRTSQEMKKTKTDNMLKERRMKNESKKEETRKANVERHKKAQAELANLGKEKDNLIPKQRRSSRKQITENTLPPIPNSPSSMGTSASSSSLAYQINDVLESCSKDKTSYDGDSRISPTASRRSKRVEFDDQVSETNEYLKSDEGEDIDTDSDQDNSDEEALPMELPSASDSLVRDAETGEVLEVGGWKPWSDAYPMITPPEAKQLAMVEAEKRRMEYIKELELQELERERRKQEALDKIARREARRQRRLERKRARLPPVEAPKFAAVEEGKLVQVPKVALGLDLVKYKFRVHGHTLDKMVNSRDVDGRNVLNLEHYATKQMLDLVEQRDKYQAHILSLLLEEQSQERRREKEVKAASVNESALAWVKKRHKMERSEARIRIERINHDNELSLMSRMVKYDI